MALRPIDNALPTSQERPKKIAKVAAAVKPETPRSVNDENAAPRQPPSTAADASGEYVSSCDLQPLADPQTKIEGLLEDLESKDWIKLCEALNDVRRLALHHSCFLHPILGNVMLVMVKAMKNPRSALCKTSIMASTDIFSSFGQMLLLPASVEEDAFDHLLLQLLLKASQDKKFVCEEAEKSLCEMACCLPPIPLLKKLQCYVKHANLKVRAKAAVSVSNCVIKMDDGAMKEFGLVDLLRIAAELLNDRLPEARESARRIVNAVHKAFSGPPPPPPDDDNKLEDCPSLEEEEESWQNFCFSNLHPCSAPSVAKIILQQ